MSDRLTSGSSGDIFIHAWDITEEGIEQCYDRLEHLCGLNHLSVGALYHSGTFLLPHNPKRIARWEEGTAFFWPQHPRWRDTRLRPIQSDLVDTPGYMAGIVDAARRRRWGLLFFTVFHFSHSMAARYPEACQVDALGERSRGDLCPGNPDVRAYDLAVVEDLMATYGADGIRHESLGFDRWGGHFVRNKIDLMPSPKQRFLLGVCFCGHCMQRARAAGVDPVPVRRRVADDLRRGLAAAPEDWEGGEPDVQWAHAALDGALWPYLQVRCDTVTSLMREVGELVESYGGAILPSAAGNNRTDRDVLGGVDHGRIRPLLRRATLQLTGESGQQMQGRLHADLAEVPDGVEPELMHNQRRFSSGDELVDHLTMARELGVRHHVFHYYGMTRLHQLEWIGRARAAWA